ncbi:MAG: HEAT repeat domain-containing protein [Ferruginibacter sp.]|nr:HEAT repeat domain-containing protein [Cytophagales bacterium]
MNVFRSAPRFFLSTAFSVLVAVSLAAGGRAAPPRSGEVSYFQGTPVPSSSAGRGVRTPDDTLARPPATAWESVGATTREAYNRVREKWTREVVDRYRPDQRVNPMTRTFLRVVFYFMATFVACTFGLLGLIVVSRGRRSRAARVHTRLKRKYQDALVELLYAEENQPGVATPDRFAEAGAIGLPEENELAMGDTATADTLTVRPKTAPAKVRLASYFDAEELEDRFHRDVLIEQILALHKNLSGATASTLRELYLELGFDEDARRRLSLYDWASQAKAVRELSQMDVAEAEPQIARLLNHPSAVLVLEVQIALLKLKPDHPFYFLQETEGEITEWQQLSLLTMISHSPTFKIPDFSQWLDAKNDSVVLFSTKMINYYNQLTASDKLIQALSHPNEKVRREVIKSLGDLEVADADGALIDRYPEEAETLQAEMLVTLGKIGTERAVAFLGQALYSPQFPLAFHAARGLVLTGPTGLDLLQQAAQTTPDLERIQRHLLDARI